MNRKPKVLIICDSPWKDNNNIGNTFSNLFGGWPQEKIAMVYARPMLPSTKICNNFFQISEKRMIKRFFNSEVKTGQKIVCDIEKNIINIREEKSGEKMYDFFLKYRFNIFLSFRELLWKIGKWKTTELNDFIDEFKPEIVLSLACASVYMNRIQQYIIKKTKAKSVIYFVDDVYSNKKFRMSLLYWINKFNNRRAIRNTVKICDRVYTIIDKQKEEYDVLFNVDSKILNKGGVFLEKEFMNYDINLPIRMIYTGNITLGRWETLVRIGKSLDKINESKKKVTLEIYSNNQIYKKIKKTFDKIASTELKGSVPIDMVKDIQSNADILVHVESLKLREKLETRLSFSTKLVNYFERGKCIVAIGWKQSASIDYLRKNRASFIINEENKIEVELKYLVNNLELIKEYGLRARLCGITNHQIEKTRDDLLEDFNRILIVKK